MLSANTPWRRWVEDTMKVVISFEPELLGCDIGGLLSYLVGSMRSPERLEHFRDFVLGEVTEIWVCMLNIIELDIVLPTGKETTIRWRACAGYRQSHGSPASGPKRPR